MDGRPFGRYRLIELLGRGGMGEVWRAFDTETSRTVAVKILIERFAEDASFQQRFRREALAVSSLNDPHVIPIHHFGEIDGHLYVDMCLVEGRDLDSVLADGPLEPRRAVLIIDQVASALTQAHRVGLVHRDVKPANVLVDGSDFTYLIDFGLAHAAEGTRVTHAGNAIGTWAYMAPERFTAQEPDPRSDVYALACVLYECLTGQRPYPGDEMQVQYAGHTSSPPPRPSAARTGVPTGFDAVIAIGMAKNPAHRYQTPHHLARAAAHAVHTPLTGPVAAHAFTQQAIIATPRRHYVVAAQQPSRAPDRSRRDTIRTAVAAAIIFPAAIAAGAAITVSLQSMKFAPPPSPAQSEVVSDYSRTTSDSVVAITSVEDDELVGSGFVYYDQYVLTTQTVADAASISKYGGQIRTVASNGEITDALIEAQDPVSGLVLIKTDAAMPSATLGDSTTIQVEDLVTAFGAVESIPIRVSAPSVAVDLTTSHGGVFVIQTDGAPDEVDMGGPLLNADGQVIGISINPSLSTGPTSSGTALPINDVRRIADALIVKGEMIYPNYGMQVLNSSAPQAPTIDIIVSDGPAARGGLLAGDLIAAVEGQKIIDMDQLMATLRRFEANEHVLSRSKGRAST